MFSGVKGSISNDTNSCNCICTNGVAATGMACTTDNATICAAEGDYISTHDDSGSYNDSAPTTTEAPTTTQAPTTTRFLQLRFLRQLWRQLQLRHQPRLRFQPKPGSDHKTDSTTRHKSELWMGRCRPENVCVLKCDAIFFAVLLIHMI